MSSEKKYKEIVNQTNQTNEKFPFNNVSYIIFISKIPLFVKFTS